MNYSQRIEAIVMDYAEKVYMMSSLDGRFSEIAESSITGRANQALTELLEEAVRASIADIPAEWVASVFHHYYEMFAPEYGYKTREDSAVPWASVPENNKKLMVAVSEEVLAGIQDRLAELKPQGEKA